MLNGEWQNDRYLSGEIQRTVIDLTGEPQEKTVVPSVETVVVEPDVTKRLTKVTVLGVTREIDENISPMNIRKGKTILGVEGNLEPDKPDQSKVVSPSVEEQVVRADTGYELASVTVKGVTSDIDENIQADNIRYGVEILGVVGSMEQKEDLDAELTEQDALLDELDGKIDTLPDKDVDLSQTTATAADVLDGKKFFNAQGEFVDGTYKDMLQQRVDEAGCAYLFCKCPLETITFLNKLDTSNVTSMEYMFQECTNLTSVDLSSLDTSNVTNMAAIFYECSKLTSVDLSSFNTSNVNSMNSMFNGCSNLKRVDVSNFNTSSVTEMVGMFRDCRSLISLDLSNFDTSNVTSISTIFYYCSSLTSLNLSNFNTSNVTGLNNVFYGCSKLRTITGTLDIISCTSASGSFNNCKNLETVTLKNIKLSISLGSGTSYGTKLTNETLINTAQELWDNTDNALGGSRTLTLSTTSKTNMNSIYVKLIDITDEMIANDPYISNKKPCVVCESTDEGAMTLTEYVISKNWAIA